MILTWNLDQELILTRETKQRQKIDYDVMSQNCYVIVIFSIYGQFGAFRKGDSGCRVFIKSNLLSYRNWKQN